jgi:hypothetical protein
MSMQSRVVHHPREPYTPDEVSVAFRATQLVINNNTNQRLNELHCMMIQAGQESSNAVGGVMQLEETLGMTRLVADQSHDATRHLIEHMMAMQTDLSNLRADLSMLRTACAVSANTTFALSEYVQQVEAKLMASEHQRLKLESVVRSYEHCSELATFNARASAARANMRDIEQTARDHRLSHQLSAHGQQQGADSQDTRPQAPDDLQSRCRAHD